MSSALHLEQLPAELHRAVHDFLTYPSYDVAGYCAVRDGGAAFRCVCVETRVSVSPPKKTTVCGSVPCCSVDRAVHRRLGLPVFPPPSSRQQNVSCAMYDYHGVSVLCYRKDFAKDRLCVAHDCCDDQLNDSERAVQVGALHSFVAQLKKKKPAISCSFPSWVALSSFSETMRRAGITVYGYKAVVTRQKEGIRVSWLKSNTN